MSDKKTLLDTTEESLYSLHDNIANFLAKQPESTHLLISQVVDYYNKIILCMPGYVYWMDRSAKAIGCNQNVLDLFKLDTQEDFYGLTFDDMARLRQWPEADKKAIEADALEVIRTGVIKANIEDPPIQNPDGSIIYFLTTRVPLLNARGDVIGIVGISTDITQQKDTERELAIAKEQAESSNRAKTEFLANMSHDIRTPLASLMALNEYLLNHINDERLNSLAKDAHVCSEQLMLLINEILEITEIDLGQTPNQVQTFHLPDLVTNIVSLMRPSAEQKDLALTAELDPKLPNVVVAHRQMLQRIMINLIGNAVKFTDQGGVTVSLTLKNMINHKATVSLEVTDTGMGIPADQQNEIFEQFKRLTSAYEGRFLGRGLGLYIVKKFADSLGATVEIKSKENKGSTFTVTFDLDIATQSQAKHIDDFDINIVETASTLQTTAMVDTPLTEMSTLTRTKILLVEDTKMAQKVAQLVLLEPMACDVDIAETGEEAITKAATNEYNMILLDIGLPDMTGMDVAQQIRDDEIKHNVTPRPIIALSAHISKTEYQQCLQSGIQQVITKPLKIQRVRALMDNWL